TVREVQQMFAELLSHGEDITWDLLSANQEDVMRSKIKELKGHPVKIFGSPNMFDNIWSQRKYTNGQSLSSLFFVMIVDKVGDPKMAEESRSWYLYPVFRCRRCVGKCMNHNKLLVNNSKYILEDNTGQNNSSLECCMTYVSQKNTIETWDKFVQDAHFRPGLMVTPNRGVYKLIDGKVDLRTYFIKGEMSVFEKISVENKRIEGTVDIIRSVNEVPKSTELNEFFKTRRHRKKPTINEVHSIVPVDVLQVAKIQIEGEEINLKDYGTALINNIECSESFEDLITNMAGHLKPEMFELILELTQSFMEKSREDLWQLLKYHFSTETVLYQIILCVTKHHPNLDCNEVRKQFSDILSRVRYYFASASPNTFPELLQKCSKCVGYYH
ncbi:hypothetical protein KR084_000889, partial [Drosophila pseudotakahashii]